MFIATNIMSINAHRNLTQVGNAQNSASKRLASGLRINSAADDAAGLAISEGMRAQIRGKIQASRNCQDGISFIQTSEGYLQAITEAAQRIRELIVQGANDTYSVEDRAIIRAEIEMKLEEIVRIWDYATFNSLPLFNDHDPGVLSEEDNFFLQVGANSTDSLPINVSYEVGIVQEMINARLDSTSEEELFALMRDGVPFNQHANINAFLSEVDLLLDNINSMRAAFGAYENRLEFTINNNDVAAENLSASESRIRDADMALEMMRLTNANVLQQAATAMLAQANQAPQNVLQLLQV
ncbi:MAG: flagellin [Clostridiales bacterium]|nr:flagellin [Clostridiales bacterium]